MSYALTTESWIPCRLNDGKIVMLGLFEVFKRSSEIVELASEWPHVNVAITKLLLAVVRQAVGGPKTLDEWLALWKDGLPQKKIADYLNYWKHRFNLLDAGRPFFQWPGIVVTKKAGMQRLVHSKACGNNTRLFDKSEDDVVWTTDLATAAQLLVGWQSYALAGGQSKPFYFSRSPLLAKGAVSFLIQSRTLAETLILNTITDETAASWHDPKKDVACWEWKELPEATLENFKRNAFGISDYMTWQCRRQLVTVTDGRATHVSILQGLGFADEETAHGPFFAHKLGADDEPRPISSDNDVWSFADVLFGSGKPGSTTADAIVQLKTAVRSGLDLPAGVFVSALGIRTDEPYGAKAEGLVVERIPLAARVFSSTLVHEALERARATDRRLRGKVLSVTKDVMFQGRNADASLLKRANSPDMVSAAFWSKLRERFFASLGGLSNDDKAALEAWSSDVETASSETCRMIGGRIGFSARGLAAAARGGL